MNPNKLPPDPPDKTRRPLKALGYIRHLYAIEYRVRRKAPPAERVAARHAGRVPVLNDLNVMAGGNPAQGRSGHPLGTPLDYLDLRWAGLVRY